MKLQHGFENPVNYAGGFVAIGNFDGVHRGHQRMISTLVDRAQSEGVPSVVLTFDPHPIEILRPEHAPPSLTTLARKAELLAKHGVDCVIAYPTDHALLQLSPEEFFQKIIRKELNARGLVEGPNFFFGRNRSGDVQTLKNLCEATQLSLEIVSPVRVGERLVSSSTIRGLIGAGEIAEAVELLGDAYRITGTVRTGAGRGRTIGFPTANLEDVQTLLPTDGVYAGTANIDGRTLAAAIHIGPNPTFQDGRQKLEVHLIDFAGDLYDRPLSVDFWDRIRGTQRFESPEALQAQLTVDVQHALEIVAAKTST